MSLPDDLLGCPNFWVVLASASLSILKTGLRIIGCCLSEQFSEATPPPGIKQLTAHLWELHSPEGIPKTEIIFFHGLQLGEFKDAFWETWVSENNKQLVWPKQWLSNRVPDARILSVSYNSSATQSAGQLPMYTLAENLFSDIILDTEHKIGQNCPVFLVGHCFGGIVIKRFIIFAKNKEGSLKNDKGFEREYAKTKTFLTNFRGVFYYATPHGGFESAKLARLLPGTSPILELVKTLSTETATINEEFRVLRKNLNARAFGVAESLPFSCNKGFNTFVVEQASTRQDIDYFYTHPAADHFTICKARHEKDPTVIEKLVQFIQNIVPKEFEEPESVDHKLEGESKIGPEEPQSQLGSSTRKLTEEVESLISSVDVKRNFKYSFGRCWWRDLEEQERKAVMSTFERNSYTRCNGSPGEISYKRN